MERWIALVLLGLNVRLERTRKLSDRIASYHSAGRRPDERLISAI
jgi:hypothetical protein